jgi:hypothetical protein
VLGTMQALSCVNFFSQVKSKQRPTTLLSTTTSNSFNVMPYWLWHVKEAKIESAIRATVDDSRENR